MHISVHMVMSMHMPMQMCIHMSMQMFTDMSMQMSVHRQSIQIETLEAMISDRTKTIQASCVDMHMDMRISLSVSDMCAEIVHASWGDVRQLRKDGSVHICIHSVCRHVYRHMYRHMHTQCV